MKNWILSLLIVGVMTLGFNVDVNAWKPGSSFSGSRSSGSFSSGSRSHSTPHVSPSRSSGSWGSKPSTPHISPSKTTPSRSSGSFGSSSVKPNTKVSPSTTTKSSGWFSSSKKSTPSVSSNKTANSVNSKINAGTKSTGKTFSSKESAISSFKKDYAKETIKGGKYSSHYASEPSVRPSHIPTTYNNHTVVYNPGYGGYGYWSGGGPGLGTWMMYDMMSDAIMMNQMAHHHGYHTGGTVYYDSGSHGLGIVCISVVIVLFLIIIIAGAFSYGQRG